MALYQRLLGLEQPKIPIHTFQAILAEWSRGKINTGQAQTIIAAVTGQALTTEEAADAQALVNTVTSIPVTGAAAAQADGRARRAMRVQELDQVLLLADTLAPGYSTEAELRSKLGV